MFNTGLLAIKTSHFDYKLGAQYDIGENSMLWVDYSTGYQQAPVQSGARSQTLKSYQAGIKSRFVEKMIQVNATGFYYDYTNFQVSISKQVIDPATGTIVTDRGSGISDANIYGLDFDTTYVFTNHDSIKFAVSYLKTAIANLTIDFQYSPDSTVYNGLELNNSPKFVFVGSYDHRFDLPNDASLTVAIDSRYTTETFLVSTEAIANPGNLYNIEPTHHISNASLNYASASGKWSLNTYVKNIENHCTKNGTNGVNPVNANFRVDPPRTFGVVLSMRY
jgi:iron complex outermembrane receptor protein